MLDVMKAEFEKRHHFAVTDDMDIIYGLVWESWQIAWNAATRFEREECAVSAGRVLGQLVGKVLR